MFKYEVENDSADQGAINPAVIKVVGCGGGGGNAVNTMIEANVVGVEFIALNTDGQDLGKSKAERKIRIGLKNARGLGAGGHPELGEEAAKESESEIKEALVDSDMVFITAGMGGGTGTGSAPVVARIAREIGALTVAVVTYPFSFENATRSRNADAGIKKLRAEVDSLIVIPNDKIFEIRDDLPVPVAFKAVTDILRQGVQGITDIIMRPGLINRDFRDVESVMKGQGQALLGIGIGKGENRAIDAATDAINNPLLKDTHIDGAKNILINVCGGENVRISECKEIATFITSRACEDVNVIWGLVIDQNMTDEISVTVIATGFEKNETVQKSPSIQHPLGKRLDENYISDENYKKIYQPNVQLPKNQQAPQVNVNQGIERNVQQVVPQQQVQFQQTSNQQIPAHSSESSKTLNTRVNVNDVLGGSPIYEDDRQSSQANQQITNPQITNQQIANQQIANQQIANQQMYQQSVQQMQQRPNPVQRPSGNRIPEGFVPDYNDLSQPTYLRERSKLEGLKSGIVLGQQRKE